MEVIGQLGIDEIAIKKGHQDFVTITSRLQGGIRLLAVLEGRKKATIVEFFESIPEQIRKTISCVCSGFYEGFINAAKQVLGTRMRIVIDQFHLAKLYRKGLDTLRKQEMRLLKNTGRIRVCSISRCNVGIEKAKRKAVSERTSWSFHAF